MRLYNRDYRSITQEEKAKYEEIKATEITGVPLGTINHYCDYPEAVKHYLSYFPNNHIFLGDVKKSCDIPLRINLVRNMSRTYSPHSTPPKLCLLSAQNRSITALYGSKTNGLAI